MGDVDKALRGPTASALWKGALDALDGVKFSGFGNSKTGNQVTLRFKIPGRKVLRAKLQTSYVDDYGSEDRLAEESIKNALWPSLKEVLCLGPVLDWVNGARARRDESVWRANVEVVDRLLEDCPALSEELWGAVRSLRDSGDHRRRAETHQVALAFRELRGPMSRALRNGATRDQIVAVLDEELVRLVQEG